MASHSVMFDDRSDAGRCLAAAVDVSALTRPVLVALSNDGLSVAFEMAHRLGLPLDFLLIQPIAAPGDPHHSIGMVVDGREPRLIVDEQATRHFRPPPGYLDSERHHQLAELDRRHRMYFGEDEPADHDHTGRDVFLVDDGTASAQMLLAAVQALRTMRVASIRLAVPVACQDLLNAIGAEVDAVICLSLPGHSVDASSAYADFDATSDQQAVRLLRDARRLDRMLH
jgi:putative phosphoribosyl transferase